MTYREYTTSWNSGINLKLDCDKTTAGKDSKLTLRNNIF